METKRKRQANFELLRIVAMLMILFLHYMGKGGILPLFPFLAKEEPVGAFGWLIEAFCIVAVNCYVLISGYFLCAASDSKSKWKSGRIGSLLAQVLFYSLLIPCVMLLVGGVSAGELTLYDWIGFVFPLGTEHYWFATSYLVMYLFAPFLAAGIRKMDKRELQILLAFLLAFFSLEKTVLPMQLPTDSCGYDFGWFLCLFVVAGYIRKYGVKWLTKQSHAVAGYLLCCVWIWLFALASNLLGASGYDAFSYYADMLYSYNHLLCLAGSVSLFYVFKNRQIKEGHFADFVCRIAPYTFGVYLLHEHILVRYEWMRWLGIEKAAGSFLFLPHMICSAIVVYAAGTVLDMARARIFRQAVKIFSHRDDGTKV